MVISMSVSLTTEQMAAASSAVASIRAGRPLYRIGGYAGTGKTTIAREISTCGHAAICAFTGKAASVLRSKGLDANTIHRTIYKYNESTRRFHKRPFVECDFFLLDEASMVSKSLWADMQSYRLPIVAIGDPGQLEPVGDDPRLMESPDVVLETIHRQAAQSTIIEFANHVRHGGRIVHGTKGDVDIIPERGFLMSLDWADQLLCGFNKTRVAANSKKRELLRFKHKIEEGDRLICLKNDNELGVFNGMMLDVVRRGESRNRHIECDLRTEDGEVMHSVEVWTGMLGSLSKLDFNTSKGLQGTLIADYGYCTTVHKFQGSEANRVAVIDEQCSVWDATRWRYTAITRAAQELRYCII